MEPSFSMTWQVLTESHRRGRPRLSVPMMTSLHGSPVRNVTRAGCSLSGNGEPSPFTLDHWGSVVVRLANSSRVARSSVNAASLQSSTEPSSFCNTMPAAKVLRNCCDSSSDCSCPLSSRSVLNLIVKSPPSFLRNLNLSVTCAKLTLGYRASCPHIPSQQFKSRWRRASQLPHYFAAHYRALRTVTYFVTCLGYWFSHRTIDRWRITLPRSTLVGC